MSANGSKQETGELIHARSYFCVIPYTDVTTTTTTTPTIGRRIPLLKPMLDTILVVISWFKKLFH